MSLESKGTAMSSFKLEESLFLGTSIGYKNYRKKSLRCKVTRKNANIESNANKKIKLKTLQTLKKIELFSTIYTNLSNELKLSCLIRFSKPG